MANSKLLRFSRSAVYNYIVINNNLVFYRGKGDCTTGATVGLWHAHHEDFTAI